MLNSLYWNSYAILSSSKFTSNNSRTQFELFIVSVSRKLECSVLEFEFLSILSVNILLGVLQVIFIVCFYL
jgi:hypothetical protein